MRKCLAVMLLAGMVLLGGCLSGGGSGSGDGSAEVEAVIEAYRGLITTRGCDESVGKGGVGGDIVFEAGAELKLLNEGEVATVVPTDLGGYPVVIDEDTTVECYKYGKKGIKKGTVFMVEGHPWLCKAPRDNFVAVFDPTGIATGLKIEEGKTVTFEGNADNGELVLTFSGAVVVNGTLKTKLTDLSYNGVVITSGDNIVVGPKGCIYAVNEGLYPASGLTLTCREASLLGGIVTGGKDVNDKVESKSGVQIIANNGSVYLAGLVKVSGSKAGLQVLANGEAGSIYCSAGIGTEGGKEKSGNITFEASDDIVLSGYDEINASGGKGGAKLGEGGTAGSISFRAASLTNNVDINAEGGAGVTGGDADALIFTAGKIVNKAQISLKGGSAKGIGGQVTLTSEDGTSVYEGSYINVQDGDGQPGAGSIVIDGQTLCADDDELP